MGFDNKTPQKMFRKFWREYLKTPLNKKLDEEKIQARMPGHDQVKSGESDEELQNEPDAGVCRNIKSWREYFKTLLNKKLDEEDIQARMPGHGDEVEVGESDGVFGEPQNECRDFVSLRRLLEVAKRGKKRMKANTSAP